MGKGAGKTRRGTHISSGMTTLELVIVSFVIATLISILGTLGKNLLQRARVRAAQGDILSFAIAVNSAYRDVGIVPTDLADLRSSSPPTGVNGSNWHGPYAESISLTDPWGNNYFYYFDIANTFGPIQFERTAGESLR